ncbi:hypothetical protein IV203_018510 [Nitzschia inconspicua]|uniref:Uncharacterized protein n=1 Tax=Nitzschia inconspicua TaxID=303405 RepID=A0A9K3M200_9STRA|nr:hypothetical protein IV203_018510 [Nitzschia inconspicua]
MSKSSCDADCELPGQQKPEGWGVHEGSSEPMDSPKRNEIKRVTLDPGQGGKLRVICLVLIIAAVLLVLATASTLALSDMDKLAPHSGSASMCETFLMKVRDEFNSTAFLDGSDVIQVYLASNGTSGAPKYTYVELGVFYTGYSGVDFIPYQLIDKVPQANGDRCGGIVIREVERSCDVDLEINWCDKNAAVYMATNWPVWEWPCALVSYFSDYSNISEPLRDSEQWCRGERQLLN